MPGANKGEARFMAKPKLENYRLRRKLCRKYCFTLYDAEETRTRARRFVKVLETPFTRQGLHAYNFLNTARMSRLLRSPSVCRIYRYGREGEHYIVVTEPVLLHTLSVFIHAAFPLPFELVVDLVDRIAAVLREAHLQGIVHGILTPNSIYVSEDGREVRMDDLGYAWLAPYLSELDEAEALYLANFMAPEVFHAQSRIDGRADLYSIGVVLHQLLTDSIPMDGLKVPCPYTERLDRSLQILRKVMPDYPPRLEHILAKTLHVNPNQRYQNMKELRHDLALLRKETHSAPTGLATEMG